MVLGTHQRPPKQESLEKVTLDKNTDTLSSTFSASERPTCIPRMGLRGLFNSGNTCYCNAALQACLLHNPATLLYALECKAFYKDLLKHACNRGKISKNKENFFLPMMGTMNLLQKFATTEVAPLYPRELLVSVRSNNVEFAGGVQHDSSLFLKYLLECLHESTKQLLSDPRERIEQLEGQREDDSDEEEWMTEEEKQACPLWSPPTDYYEREVSFVSEIFRGRLLNEVSCHGCGHVSRRRELFWDLAVEVPYGKRSIHHFQNAATQFRNDQSFDSTEYCASESHRIVPRKRANSSLGISFGNSNNHFSRVDSFSNSQWLGWLLSPFRDTIDLRTILCHFFVPEDIVKSEYKCAKCRKSQQIISRKSSLIELPETLIITLKRFRYEGNRGFKVSTHVQFPLDDLDLGKFLAVDAVYEKKNRSTRYYLGGVVCHKGSLFSGHYIAYVKLPPVSPATLSHWYEFDDACVRQISANEVQNASSQAYVLVYYKYSLETTEQVRTKWKLNFPTILSSSLRCILDPNESSLDNTTFQYLVSRLWIWRLSSFSHPSSISNAVDLLCPHSHISNEQVWKDKCYRVEESLWKELYSCFGGGPCLLLDNVTIGCDECLCRLRHLEQRRKEEKETVENWSQWEDNGIWYLIDAQWFNQWQQFCMGYEIEPPGPITNGRIIKE
ncbi:ubiquitin carboxyl-terminal hydrolase 2/33 [Galdieria sulphuraria]|uniref:Ubiquitin carboxyl-terminal hydrolase n=1 Tax=Galdieria sulphuraria TaxID=130081 RepID=M2XUC5_GALSU|nr:ubiquitin carboxyl-terminal hydrolase 2/33 [Galdieria sulphuraria]EME27019.1 ubiquitin carboxyl-terminal hydrolase 2/33 [Galdieria sulphuraria]|eukprot:XP_005703539.1 ubiquitin carboxyl-terminal hydrolase 2/33 [Galdieria sulphuraria]